MPKGVYERRVRERQSCLVDGCEQASKLGGMCRMHYERVKRHGDAGPPSRLSGSGDDIQYHAVHARLRNLRGAASDHQCLCGERANEWAYLSDESDPLARVDDQGRRYSTDLSRYFPMCRKCHYKNDRDSHLGERAPRAKLTADDVQAIRMSYDAGDSTQRELADRYGVAKSSIGAVVRREVWRHV